MYNEDLIYNKYSEDQIRYFIKNNKVDRYFWYNISKYQTLSEQFLMEFIDKIDLYWLEMNEKISQEVKDRIIAYKKVMDC